MNDAVFRVSAPAGHGYLGSTTINADLNATKQGEVRYYAWGSEHYTSGSLPTTYRFAGQRFDAYIHLYWYGSRFYDLVLGDFAQADTIVPQLANPQRPHLQQ